MDHQYQQLTRDSKPGDCVYWDKLSGPRDFGRLKEWDNGTAIIVRANGREVAVRCDVKEPPGQPVQ